MVLSPTLDEHLEEVEELGFRRDSFPLYYNGHEIWLLQNDARVTVDDRLQVHFTLYCNYCDEEHTLRGRAPPNDWWIPQHLQDVKLAALHPFIEVECGQPLHI